jgi:hypothetical protein
MIASLGDSGDAKRWGLVVASQSLAYFFEGCIFSLFPATISLSLLPCCFLMILKKKKQCVRKSL